MLRGRRVRGGEPAAADVAGLQGPRCPGVGDPAGVFQLAHQPLPELPPPHRRGQLSGTVVMGFAQGRVDPGQGLRRGRRPRWFTCRYRLIDSTICRPTPRSGGRSTLRGPCRTCSLASALITHSPAPGSLRVGARGRARLTGPTTPPPPTPQAPSHHPSASQDSRTRRGTTRPATAGEVVPAGMRQGQTSPSPGEDGKDPHPW